MTRGSPPEFTAYVWLGSIEFMKRSIKIVELSERTPFISLNTTPLKIMGDVLSETFSCSRRQPSCLKSNSESFGLKQKEDTWHL